MKKKKEKKKLPRNLLIVQARSMNSTGPMGGSEEAKKRKERKKTKQKLKTIKEGSDEE